MSLKPQYLRAVPLVMVVCFALAALAISHLDAFGDGPNSRATYRVQRPVEPIFRLSAGQHPYDEDWLHVERMMKRKCLGCHRPGTERVDFSNYETLLAGKTENGSPLIKPGDPSDSPFWNHVNWNFHARPESNAPDSPLMPENEDDYLTELELEAVKGWIERGALQYRLPDQCNTSPLMTRDFPSAKECSACHPRQYSEWSRSMHAYAQQSPVFEAFNATLLERTSGTLGTFCARCHTPVGTALGEPAQLANIHRTRLSKEGVTCIVCHRRADGRYKASGRVTFEPGHVLNGCIYGPFDGAGSTEIQAHPSRKSSYLKSSQFCGECHDVTAPTGVRLEEAFSEWHNSPAAKQRITCQQCHMGPVQGQPYKDCERPLGRAARVPGVPDEALPLRRLSSHSFAGPDYSLLPDTEFPEKLDWMYERPYWDSSKLTPHQQVRLRELRIRNRSALAQSSKERYQLLANAVAMRVNVEAGRQPGSPMHIDVLVASQFNGHNFPTGFTAERQLWLNVEVFDPLRRRVYASGDLDSNGDLRDDHSALVQKRHLPIDHDLVNFQSKFIALAHRGTERSVVLSVNRDLRPINIFRPATQIAAAFGRPTAFRVSKASLHPLGSRKKRFTIRELKMCGNYQVVVRLQFRHLPPHLLDYIGVAHLKPKLEIVTLSQFATRVTIGDSNSQLLPPEEISPESASLRGNDAR